MHGDGVDFWYKHGVIYGVDVERYADGNGDGVGDFRGLTSRLDYLASLGVTCLWLLPFFESPNRDNGYDIVDYYRVDPRLGTLGDFVEFVHRAEQMGIRILVDLVLNHTSDAHPWFQSARNDPDSPFREFYLWSREKPSPDDELIMFPGPQQTNWTYDEVAGAYYMHRFYSHQPDLNITSPRVREEMRLIMGFWLELGISGFRVDAAPHLIELSSEDGRRGREDFEFLGEMHRFASWRSAQSVLLAEANVDREVVPEYVGGGDRMQMLFDFILNQQLVLALVRQDATPLVRGLEASPSLPRECQWVQFLRNQDELDLRRLSDEERRDVFRAWGPEPEMQVYGRGIRRRLAPMLDGDRRRIELAYSLLFTLPGTPLLVYGDEIGMGEDLSQPERESVRTVMQWSSRPDAGFSTSRDVEVKRPIVRGGRFGIERVNVADQEADRSSLLNWMRTLIHARRRHSEIGAGRYELLDAGSAHVVAAASEWEGNRVITLHSLSDRPQRVRLSDPGGCLLDVFGNREYERPRGDLPELELDAYGYRWLSVLPGGR